MLLDNGLLRDFRGVVLDYGTEGPVMTSRNGYTLNKQSDYWYMYLMYCPNTRKLHVIKYLVSDSLAE